MNIRQIERLKQALGETGQGTGIGALAGSIAGLLLGLAAPFHGWGRLRTSAVASGIGAITGGAIGNLIWRLPGDFASEGRQADLADLPGRWMLFQEQTVEITETAEVPVITKQARQVEEAVVHRVESEHLATLTDTVRQTEVDIQQEHGASAHETEIGSTSQSERDKRRPATSR
jgi:hypothetical protein